jgi:hypothetical protein
MLMKPGLTAYAKLLLSNGFRVFTTRDAEFRSYFYFEHHNKIGYVQEQKPGEFCFSTKHRPCRTNGTGFYVALAEPTVASAEATFILAPNWVTPEKSALVKKYKDCDDFFRRKWDSAECYVEFKLQNDVLIEIEIVVQETNSAPVVAVPQETTQAASQVEDEVASGSPSYKLADVHLEGKLVRSVLLLPAVLPFTDSVVFVVDPPTEIYKQLHDFKFLRSRDSLSMPVYMRILKQTLATIDISMLSDESAAIAKQNQYEMLRFIDKTLESKKNDK